MFFRERLVDDGDRLARVEILVAEVAAVEQTLRGDVEKPGRDLLEIRLQPIAARLRTVLPSISTGPLPENTMRNRVV